MRMVAVAAAIGLSACTSVSHVGVLTRSSGDPGALLSEARPYTELGSVEGEACRNFVLGIIPSGDSTITAAMEKALSTKGGDAIINASVETSLYSFLPIYNIYATTCTKIRGIAIKFDEKA